MIRDFLRAFVVAFGLLVGLALIDEMEAQEAERARMEMLP